jgi:RNA polymerase sigma factor (sigma-70 family)
MDNAEVGNKEGKKAIERELESVMDQHESALLRYATRLVNDPNTAQDVVQDVFLRMFRGWKDGAKPTPQLSGWLYRVTHNVAVDYIRRESRLRILRRKHSEVLPITAPANPSEQLEKQSVLSAVLRQLRKLDPKEQQIVILRLQEGLSYRQIGEITMRSEGNVGFILHHAMKKLSKFLVQDGVMEGGAS